MIIALVRIDYVYHSVPYLRLRKILKCNFQSTNVSLTLLKFLLI